MQELIGVIPAAGKGMRARPDSLATPKPLFEINGTTILQRNIELLRDQMGVRKIIIITNDKGALIEDLFGDGSQFGVQLHYVINTNLDRGMAWSIYLSREYITDYFCVILGDEFYLGSNHGQLIEMNYRQALATCAVQRNAKPEQIKENYTVRLDESGAITRLVEKPAKPENDLLGCGTFMLSAEIFPLLQETYKQDGYPVDFVSFLDTLCNRGFQLHPFWLTGGYVNVNDQDGLKLATLKDTQYRSEKERGVEESHSMYSDE